MKSLDQIKKEYTEMCNNINKEELLKGFVNIVKDGIESKVIESLKGLSTPVYFYTDVDYKYAQIAKEIKEYFESKGFKNVSIEYKDIYFNSECGNYLKKRITFRLEWDIEEDQECIFIWDSMQKKP